MFNGDRLAQTSQDADNQQRTRLLFSLPNTARAKVHSLGECAAQRLKAEQSLIKH